MALRFTETNKWKDDWFLSLDNDWRIIWLWLVDNCSIGGFWKKGFTHLNLFCGTKIAEKEFFEVFKGRVFLVEKTDFIFIPKFLKVQYPSGIGSDKPLIRSVRKEIELHNVRNIINQSLGNHYLMIKDNGNGNGKGKGNGKGEREKPPIDEFLNYCKEHLKNRYVPLVPSLKAKYEAWVENGWKDGFNEPIKNWKTKIKNTIPHLKPDNSLMPKTAFA
jgi:hypothetical protein